MKNIDEVKSSRKWLLTINNPLDKGWDHFKIKSVLSTFKSVTYYCLCDEVGLENGTFHTHVFIYSPTGIKWTTVLNKFPNIHRDYCNGTAEANRTYLRKEGKWADTLKYDTRVDGSFEEWGDLPLERQGKRNDLEDLYDMIRDGASDYDILASNPSYMTKIDLISKTRQIILQDQYSDHIRNVEVNYIYGKTGSGKTRYIMEKYGYNNVFRVTDYSHPFDSYSCENVIVFDEFRTSLKITEMLNYLDIYPLSLPCRYNNKIACFTKIFIVSNIPLSDQFINVARSENETYLAFCRRINNYFFFDYGKKFIYDRCNDHQFTSFSKQIDNIDDYIS